MNFKKPTLVKSRIRHRKDRDGWRAIATLQRGRREDKRGGRHHRTEIHRADVGKGMKGK